MLWSAHFRPAFLFLFFYPSSPIWTQISTKYLNCKDEIVFHISTYVKNMFGECVILLKNEDNHVHCSSLSWQKATCCLWLCEVSSKDGLSVLESDRLRWTQAAEIQQEKCRRNTSLKLFNHFPTTSTRPFLVIYFWQLSSTTVSPVLCLRALWQYICSWTEECYSFKFPLNQVFKRQPHRHKPFSSGLLCSYYCLKHFFLPTRTSCTERNKLKSVLS